MPDRRQQIWTGLEFARTRRLFTCTVEPGSTKGDTLLGAIVDPQSQQLTHAAKLQVQKLTKALFDECHFLHSGPALKRLREHRKRYRVRRTEVAVFPNADIQHLKGLGRPGIDAEADHQAGNLRRDRDLSFPSSLNRCPAIQANQKLLAFYIDEVAPLSEPDFLHGADDALILCVNATREKGTD